MGKRRVLFICTGNVCRSLMAELLLNDMAARRGLDLEARSCGVAAERYFQVPDGVWIALKPWGIEPRTHTPRLVSRELIGWADAALTMTRAQREHLLDCYPEFSAKVHTLRRYGELTDGDIADPIGQPDAVYAACRDGIREALEALLTRLVAGGSRKP